jgi:phosphatidylserine synthase
VEECRVSRNKVSLFILLFLPCAMIFPTKFWSLSGLASGDKVHYLDLVVIELFWIFLLVHVLLILPLTHDLIYFGFVLRICRSSSY